MITGRLLTDHYVNRLKIKNRIYKDIAVISKVPAPILRVKNPDTLFMSVSVNLRFTEKYDSSSSLREYSDNGSNGFNLLQDRLM